MACQTENWPIHKGRCAFLKENATQFDLCKDSFKKVMAGARRPQWQLNVELCVACMLGQILDIERIIAAGGCVNQISSKGLYPLCLAACIGVLVRHGTG